MSIPEHIKKMVPAEYGSVSIRPAGDRYYVYQVHAKWSTEKNRAKKVTGKCVGKITEEAGFVPNRNGINVLLPKVYEVGAYAWVGKCCEDTYSEIDKAYGEFAELIKTIVTVMIVHPDVSAHFYPNLLGKSLMLREHLPEKQESVDTEEKARLEYLDQTAISLRIENLCRALPDMTDRLNMFLYGGKSVKYTDELHFLDGEEKRQYARYEEDFQSVLTRSVPEELASGHRIINQIAMVCLLNVLCVVKWDHKMRGYTLRDLLTLMDSCHYVQIPRQTVRKSSMTSTVENLIEHFGLDTILNDVL